MTYTSRVFALGEGLQDPCHTCSHACSDYVHTRDDTVRLNYASRFVRVIYSSQIVSIKLGTVTRAGRN